MPTSVRPSCAVTTRMYSEAAGLLLGMFITDSPPRGVLGKFSSTTEARGRRSRTLLQYARLGVARGIDISTQPQAALRFQDKRSASSLASPGTLGLVLDVCLAGRLDKRQSRALLPVRIYGRKEGILQVAVAGDRGLLVSTEGDNVVARGRQQRQPTLPLLPS